MFPTKYTGIAISHTNNSLIALQETCVCNCRGVSAVFLGDGRGGTGETKQLQIRGSKAGSPSSHNKRLEVVGAVNCIDGRHVRTLFSTVLASISNALIVQIVSVGIYRWRCVTSSYLNRRSHRVGPGVPRRALHLGVADLLAARYFPKERLPRPIRGHEQRAVIREVHSGNNTTVTLACAQLFVAILNDKVWSD